MPPCGWGVGGIDDVAPNPKEMLDPNVGALEYGYASRSFLADWSSACSAVSRVGLGMSERSVGLSSG